MNLLFLKVNLIINYLSIIENLDFSIFKLELKKYIYEKYFPLLSLIFSELI